VTKKQKIKIIPLGGMNEIGKNITVFEYGNEMIVLDCGLAFPDDEMLGVDLVIPDTTYLVKNKERISAIILTHGHEDHIGALPYVLREINVPIYGTRLTLGILETRLKEHGLSEAAKLNTVKAGDIITLGSFKVEFINVNHSIPDSVSVALHTPAGIIVHTGDFKIDCTPIQGNMIDLARFGELGKQGVLALLSDSTNVERKGYTMSESTVGDTFNEIFEFCDQRIIVASFASNIHRIQQVFDAANRFGRKVAVSGRSMENVVGVALELGYMNVPDGLLISIDEINKYRKDQLVIVTTGSQGEPMSALSRMAFSDHKKVELGVGDLVIISATPIPGNEKLVSRVINELFKRGAEVIYEALAEVHVSGHACSEELKLMLKLVNPKYFMPVHGEFRHLRQHAKLAQKLGVNSNNIFIMDIGKVLELSYDEAKIVGTVPSGRVFVDGLGVGDVGNIVIRDRRHLSQDGLIVIVVSISNENGSIIAGPDIISRGFVYVRESEDLIENVKNVAKETIKRCEAGKITDWSTIKSMVKSSMGEYIYEKTKRKPMILPVIMEV